MGIRDLFRPVRHMRPGFRRNDEGAATIELVIWIPFFMGLLFLAVDVSVFAFRYSEMWDVARETARALSVGSLPRDAALVESYIHGRLTPDYQVTLTGLETVWFTVEIRATSTTMSVFGLFDAVIDTMTARIRSGQELVVPS